MESANNELLKIDIDNYSGPLDVLLTLAKTQKVDLANISITQLADQFVEFIQREKEINLDIASEFLLMATWLTYLKSKLLLPDDEEDEFKATEVAEKLKLQLKKLELIRLFSDKLLNDMIREQNYIVHSLDICLKEQGIPLSINDVRSLAEGQLAAPDNLDPDAWIELVDPNLSEKMRKELKKFKENLASLEVEKELPPEERLASLRVELISRRLDGFLVPLSDEYQSEFPPSHSQRLAWLTGFTGSAGSVLIINNKFILEPF